MQALSGLYARPRSVLFLRTLIKLLVDLLDLELVGEEEAARKRHGCERTDRPRTRSPEAVRAAGCAAILARVLVAVSLDERASERACVREREARHVISPRTERHALTRDSLSRATSFEPRG